MRLRRALSAFLSLFLVFASFPPAAVQAVTAEFGACVRAPAAVGPGQAAVVPFEAFGGWIQSSAGQAYLGDFAGLGGLALLLPQTEGGQAVASAIASRLIESDPSALGRLEGIAGLRSPEEVRVLLASVEQALGSARQDLLAYAGLVSRRAPEGPFGKKDLEAFSGEFEAMHLVFGDEAFREAREVVDAKRHETFLDRVRKAGRSVGQTLSPDEDAPVRATESKARRKARVRRDEYSLGAAYMRLGRRDRAVTVLEFASDGGHERSRRLLEQIPDAHASERLPGRLNPFKPDAMADHLGTEKEPPRFFTPLAALMVVAFGATFIGGRLLGIDTGFFSLTSRIAVGVAGFLWMFHEWRTRSAGGWSWKMGFRNGLVALTSAALWMLPFMVGGIFLQPHDPVPQVAEHFGGYTPTMLLMPMLVSFEEVVFRLGLFAGFLRLLQRFIANKNAGFFIAALASAALFGLVHLQYNILFMIGVAIIGYFNALAYYQTRWLWVPIAAHLYLNLYAIGFRMILKFLFGIDGLW